MQMVLLLLSDEVAVVPHNCWRSRCNKEGASLIHTTIYYFAIVDEKGSEIQQTTAADREEQQMNPTYRAKNNGEGVKKFIRELIVLYVV